MGDTGGNRFNILFHIPIPNVNNDAGITYRTALVGSGLGGLTRMETGVGAGKITAAEATQIANGEIYEHEEFMTTYPGEAATGLRNRVDARYTQLANASGDFLKELQNQLRFYGFDRNVP